MTLWPFLFFFFYAIDSKIATLNTHPVRFRGKASFQTTYTVSGLLNSVTGCYPRSINSWTRRSWCILIHKLDFLWKVYCSCASIFLMYVSCFSPPVLADLLEKVVAHLSNSATECFFSPAQYKGQWGRATHAGFTSWTIKSNKNSRASKADSLYMGRLSSREILWCEGRK